MGVLHISLSVTGSLKKSDKDLRRDLKGVLIVDGKTLVTAKDIRQFLTDELTLGHEVLPFGDCDNFDFKTGCKGHSAQNNE